MKNKPVNSSITN